VGGDGDAFAGPADFALERELWGRGVTTVAGVDEVGVVRLPAR